jgi:predicted MFS family arabinose efflux permease
MALIFIPRAAPAPEQDGGTAAGTGAIAAVLLAAFCSMITFFTAVIVLPFSLSRVAGLSEAAVGYFLSGVSLVAVCFASIMPKLSGRIGERTTLIFAFLCYGAAHILFALAPALPLFAAGGILLGAGFGLSVPLANHMTVERSPPHLRGRYLANLSVAIFLGQFLASPLQYVPGGQDAAFACAAGIAFVAAAAGLTRFARL